GGFDVPLYLGSAATFTLGRFGGHGGRALQAGDGLRAGTGGPFTQPAMTPADRRPALVRDWEIGVTEGPHAAPEFFTRADIDELYASSYTVHHNSARTGVRLNGPRPSWAREDGGEAGLHPSNIHDVPYAVGALDFTGDTLIIRGPDGPAVVYRRDGDDNVIVEYGDPVLDVGLRIRVHALQEALAAQGLPGVIDLTPG